MSLRLVEVHKALGGRAILQGISLSVPSGSVTTLLGRSGCGKSTLLRICAGLSRADTGTIEVTSRSGRSMLLPNPNGWPMITAVLQDVHLWPHLTAYQNVSMPLETRLPKEAGAKTRRVLAEFEVEHLSDVRAIHLSRGESQLVGLARAFALEPEVLLLDEATASLDLERSYLVVRQIRDLAIKGTAVLFITHQVGLAHTVSDRIAFMESGRILEEGTADVLHTPVSDQLQSFLRLARSLG